MNRRFWGALLGAWIIIMLVVMNLVLIHTEDTEKDGSYFDGCSTEDAVYAIDRRDSGSYAYRLNEKGKVSEMIGADTLGFEEFDDIVTADDGVAVAVSRKNDVLSYEGRSYQIVIMSDRLAPTSYSPVFTLHEGSTLSHISQEAGIWYIGTVSDDGATAWVYSINASEFKEAGVSTGEEPTALEEDKSATIPKEVYSKNADSGRSYIESVFRASTLYIRTDREAPGDAFAADEKSREAYNSLDVGITGRIRMHTTECWIFVSFMAAGAIALLAILIWLKRRPLFAQAIALIMTTAMVLGALGILATQGIRISAEDQAVEDMKAQVVDISKDVYEIGVGWIGNEDTEMPAYQSLVKTFDTSATDMLLVDSRTSLIQASHSKNNLVTVANLYGNSVASLCNKAIEGLNGEGIVRIHGKRYAVSAYSLRRDYGMEYVVLGMGEVSDTFKSMLSDILFLIILAVAATVLAVLIRTFVWKRSLDVFAQSMTAISDGRGAEIEIPENTGILSRHWEILNEIAAVFRRMNYKTYQIYEAYFRFAPKKIETILGKSSIAEVECGDVANFNGTEAILTLSDSFNGSGSGIHRANELLNLMEKHQEKIGGVLVSGDMSSGQVKLLFKKTSQTLGFGLDFLHEADTVWNSKETGSTIILHYGNFRYGVVGTPRQSMAFLDSMESRVLEKYSTWLYRQGLRLVITEDMKEHEGVSGNIRYIGFIKEEDVRLDLYEVIDANTAAIRSGKLATLAKYNEALENFRNSNFYFARNIFSEILREVPGDALVKWYLFESERYLNQAPGDELLKLNAD